ncbi:YbbR-like domain-containing protein [Candidatus Omnitrophota bacterium]
MKDLKAGSNITAKVISAVFALILWLVITLNATYTYEASIPINYVGLAEGLMMTGSYPHDIKALIRGTGKALLLFKIREIKSPESHYAFVSLSGLTTKGKHQVNLSPGNILLTDNGGLEVRGLLANEFISLLVDRVVTKSIPVDIGSIPPYQLEKGYAVSGAPLVKPELIVVRGPENVLETMESIPFDSYIQDKISLKQPVLRARIASQSDDVSYDPENVDIFFTVEPLTRKVFKGVPLNLSSFPNTNIPLLVPDTFSVTIQGPESIVSTLEPGDVLITVHYQAFLDSISQGKKTLRPEVTLPEGVSVTLTPEFISFSINSTSG